MPSSIRITVRPSRSRGGRSPRKLVSSASARARASSMRACSSPGDTSRAWSVSVTSPSDDTAPIASSGCAGWPTLRMTQTSSGARRARATGAATSTPPRAMPSTAGFVSPRSCSASCAPAALRSWKICGTGQRREGADAELARGHSVVHEGVQAETLFVAQRDEAHAVARMEPLSAGKRVDHARLDLIALVYAEIHGQLQLFAHAQALMGAQAGATGGHVLKDGGLFRAGAETQTDRLGHRETRRKARLWCRARSLLEKESENGHT